MNALLSGNGGIITEIRSSDGYVNASKMCRSGGKLWANYYQGDITKEFLEALSSNIGIPILRLVVSQRGGNHSGTWVHHRVAINLATWISPEFAVAVTGLVERYLTGQVTTEESQQVAVVTASTNIVRVVDDASQLVLQSAGYGANVLGDQVYFGLPGPKLVMEIDRGGIKVKFGVTKTGNEKQRFDDHVSEYGGFTLLDCIQCDYPERLEERLKTSLHMKAQRSGGRAGLKRYRDTELIIVRDQQEYNELVHSTKNFIEQFKIFNENVLKLSLEKEKTKQGENSRKVAEQVTLQEQEKTKQMQLELEMLRLRLSINQQPMHEPTTIENNTITHPNTTTIDEDIMYTTDDDDPESVNNITTTSLPTIDEATYFPTINEPVSLLTSYEEWNRGMRAYFQTTVRIPWKAKLGDRAPATKLRFCKLRPYFVYIDKHARSPDDVLNIITKLEVIRQQHRVSVPVFIKQCFYSLHHPPSAQSIKPPPIMPNMLLSAMLAAGLPPLI
jgi:hypothetical protein